MSDSKNITVVFEPASQAYRANIHPIDGQGSGVRGPVFAATVFNTPVMANCSAHAAYYAVLTPSGARAISGVSTFTTDVTFTMGMLLTVFHD